MDFRKIKDESKAVLAGNRFMLFVVILIAQLIVGALASIGIGFLIAPIFTAGIFVVCKRLINERKLDFNDLFTFFKDFNHAAKLIGVYLLTALYVFLGMFLFIIPGIIFAYQYSQSVYIMAENPDIRVGEAMSRSKEMMRGYKFDFFIFGLSFIGHYLLIGLTFGLYGIYIIPYIQTSMTNYYRHLSGQNVITPVVDNSVFDDDFDNPRF